MFALGPDNPATMAPPAHRLSDTISGGYTQIPEMYYHPRPSRNALGLFAGNDVSPATGNLVDLEAELRGITRDLSRDPSKKYQPSCPLGVPTVDRSRLTSLSQMSGTDTSCQGSRILYFTERSTGRLQTIDTSLRHLPTIQYVSYPGVPTPDPLITEVHGAPWRF